jgi:hypothetical protein
VLKTRHNFTKKMSSVVSSTDVQIFKRLANQQVVNVDLASSAQRKAFQSIRSAVEEEEAKGRNVSPPRPAEDTVTRAPSVSSVAAALERARQVPVKDDDDDGDGAIEEGGGGTKTDASAEEQQEPLAAAPPRPVPVASQEYRRPAPPPPTAQQANSREEEDERLEKQGFLIELRRMEARGVSLSRTFTEDDSLAELEFEVAKQNAAISAESSVNFMRETLKIIVNGVEIGNKRLGPFLSIDGWAESATKDMHKYDHALERIYKRYFRKHQMSPIMEMGWLLVGSMAMWHFKSKFFGVPSPSAMTQPPPEPKAPPFPPRNFKRAAGPAASSGGDAPAAGAARRPVLRGPALFGA